MTKDHKADRREPGAREEQAEDEEEGQGEDGNDDRAEPHAGQRDEWCQSTAARYELRNRRLAGEREPGRQAIRDVAHERHRGTKRKAHEDVAPDARIAPPAFQDPGPADEQLGQLPPHVRLERDVDDPHA